MKNNDDFFGSFVEWSSNLFGFRLPRKEKRGIFFYFIWGMVAAALLPTPIFWGLFIYYLLRNDLKHLFRR